MLSLTDRVKNDRKRIEDVVSIGDELFEEESLFDVVSGPIIDRLMVAADAVIEAMETTSKPITPREVLIHNRAVNAAATFRSAAHEIAAEVESMTTGLRKRISSVHASIDRMKHRQGVIEDALRRREARLKIQKKERCIH